MRELEIARQLPLSNFLTTNFTPTKTQVDDTVPLGYCDNGYSVVVAGFVLFKTHLVFQKKEQKLEFISVIKNILSLSTT